MILERLRLIEEQGLKKGDHAIREEGMCAMEAVAYLAGDLHNDAPHCVDCYLRDFVVCLNDTWYDRDRQALISVLPAVLDTRPSTRSHSLRVRYWARRHWGARMHGRLTNRPQWWYYGGQHMDKHRRVLPASRDCLLRRPELRQICLEVIESWAKQLKEVEHA